VGGARFGSFVFRVPLFLSGIEFELIAWFLAFFWWLVGWAELGWIYRQDSQSLECFVVNK
jgi:hypothetical protein